MPDKTRPGLLAFLFAGTLFFLSLHPIRPLEAALAQALAPIRFLAETTVPLGWLRSPVLHAADEKLAIESATELARRQALLADLVRFAEPSPVLARGRRLIPGAVVGRHPGNRDRLFVRVPPGERVEAGYPVVLGDAYVGRVFQPVPDEPGTVEVDLVTGSKFHVGAIRPAETEQEPDVRMTVGGIDPAGAGADALGPGGSLLLAVHNPSDREVRPGPVVVGEMPLGSNSLEARSEVFDLADGYALGDLLAWEGGWSLIPVLDFRDGLFQVTILAPDRGGERSRPLPEELEDDGWRPTRALTQGDPSHWREAVAIDAGTRAGVEEGSALVSGLRLLGRVGRAQPLSSDVRLLGDPGMSVVAVARLEGFERPYVLGRLVSAGRDQDTGAVHFEWSQSVPLEGVVGRVPAVLYTGSGLSGLPRGLLIGKTVLDFDAVASAQLLEVRDAMSGLNVGDLWVRTRPSVNVGSEAGR